MDLAESKLKQLIESKKSVISKHADIMSRLCDDCRPIFAKYYKLDQYETEIKKASEKIDKILIGLAERKSKASDLSVKRSKIDDKIREIDGRIRTMS